MNDHVIRKAGPALLAVLIWACAGAFAQAPAASNAVNESQAGQPTTWPPPDRLDEFNPGVTGGIPNVPVTVDLTAAGLSADGKTDVSAALQRAIDGAKTPGAVLLPPGTFLLTEPVNLKTGVVLRGAGLDRTLLIAREDGQQVWPPLGALQAVGKRRLSHNPITAGATRGSRQLTLASAAGLEAGDLILVQCARDQTFGEYVRGQIVRLVKVEGTTVTLDAPLRVDYDPALTPFLEKLAPVTDVGIEDLHIRRENQAEHATIRFDCAADCWVRDCETEMGMKYHIEISCSREVTVENCCIHGAESQAGGGHGYGVEIDGWASDCLVMNNIFYTMRHAMIIQNEANGCVYAYNYSFDSFGCGGDVTNVPPWFHSPDISVHGGWACGDLYEGNVVTAAAIGDRQAVGPRIVLFRNRVAMTQKAHDLAHYAALGGKWTVRPGISMILGEGFTVIGNTVSDDGKIMAEIATAGGVPMKGINTCHDLLIAGNFVGGRMLWTDAQPTFKGSSTAWDAGSAPGTPISPRPLPASLFLKAKPAFWGDKPWPCVGADVDSSGTMMTIPAQDWYGRTEKAGHPIPFSAPASAAGAAEAPAAPR